MGSMAGLVWGLVDGAAMGMYSAPRAGIVVAAAVAGGFVESLLGATLGRSGILGNESMNLLNTAVGGGACLTIALALES